MSRDVDVRIQRLTELKGQIALAVKRLQQARIDHPEINVFNGVYGDGSYREQVNHLGGVLRPEQHIWAVVRIGERDVYIHELVDWEVWYEKPFDHELSELDTGKYELALSNPAVAMYQNQGMYIGSINYADLPNVDWDLGLIEGIIDHLKVFYLPEDLERRIALASAT